MDVEATRSIRQAEVGAVKTMIDRVQKTHNLMPERLIADTAYGSGPMLDWLVEKRGIAPHIPVIDKSGRKDGTFERADFTYDAGNDLYICPNGNELKQYRRAFKTPRSGANKDETVRCQCPIEMTRAVEQSGRFQNSVYEQDYRQMTRETWTRARQSFDRAYEEFHDTVMRA